MTTKLLLLASLVMSSVAAADAPTPPPPPSPHPLRVMQTCDASGDVLFEIDHRSDAAMNATGVHTSELVLFETGAWTYAEHDAKGLVRRASGCLRFDTMRRIEHDLAEATWTAKHAEAACMAYSADYMAYSMHGKLVWTERMCQIDYLDETSAKALAEVTKILDDASRPHAPPCCKK